VEGCDGRIVGQHDMTRNNNNTGGYHDKQNGTKNVDNKKRWFLYLLYDLFELSLI
jgi:hypothetical protein